MARYRLTFSIPRLQLSGRARVELLTGVDDLILFEFPVDEEQEWVIDLERLERVSTDAVVVAAVVVVVLLSAAVVRRILLPNIQPN